MSDPNAQLYLTIGGEFNNANFGIRDGDFEMIANHPPLDPWLYNLSKWNSLLMPVPNQPDRLFLFAPRQFDPQVRKYGWLEIGPDGPGGQLRMTDIGPHWFMPNPAVKCAGVAHADGVDYWFLTQSVGTNEVHAFRVSETGVDPTPVISPGGVIITEQDRFGFIVASAQSDRFVSFTKNPSLLAAPVIELYSFDPATGIAALMHTFQGLTGQTWGVEFSPSGRYVYILRGEGLGGTLFRHTFYQYDLDQADIEGSRVDIDTHDEDIGGAQTIQNNLCLGPDGRIYGNRAPTIALACIPSPNEAAPNCGFLENSPACPDSAFWVPHPMKYYHDDAALGVTALERSALRVWPNPVMEQGVVSGVGDGQIQLQWCDALGRVIQEGTSLAQDGRVSIDVQALPSGAYVLNVMPKNGMPASVRVSVLH